MAEFNFSVFTQTLGVRANGPTLVDAVAGILRPLDATDRWKITNEGIWCTLTPRGVTPRSQGWKLHLSATILSAETVLTRVLPVLLRSGSAFKFASTLEHVDRLNARHTPRGHSGKFITIYPECDEEAVRLAGALQEATIGLAGPRILSDRPYVPGSLVHYRYGAFVEARRLSNDGLYSWVIFDPDGNPVEDRRSGTYQPPPWAPCPFPIAENGTVSDKSDGQGVLIGDRFRVLEAIRHSNKGGVYRAVDTTSGADAVIKEARPHVAANDMGRDVRDLLRAEARALEKARPAGVAPRLLKLFEQSQHVFLAEELVPGVPLREWVLDGIRNGGWRRHVPGALEMAGRVAELMDVAHQAGLILRDFNPNNIMVRPDGELRLIDLELAVMIGEEDEETARAATPGFGAPEQLDGAPPALEADYYSLGATICFVVTGSAPFFLADHPKGRPLRERLADWLTVRCAAIDLPAELQTLILGLMDDEPEQRWTASTARGSLARALQQSERAASQGQSRQRNGVGSTDHRPHDERLGDEQWQEAVDGSVGYLLTAMTPADPEHLWSTSCANGAPDPCILQLGAAGVVGVLTRYFELTRDPRLPEAMSTAGRWIIRRLELDARRPPGLYYGEAGAAWSLYEAGHAVGDDHLMERALALAAALPTSSENPDVTHGTAGIGLTFLQLWLRTRDEQFLQRAGRAADALVASASEEPSGISWGTPAAFDSRLAGGRYHGFSHGTAGVGYALLAMALATGRPDCLELANRAGETLLANAIVEDGVAQWGAGPGDKATAPYWCHGSAGIGSFLIRLYGVTGDDRYRKMADLSAQAVMENSWRGVLGQCHGLAGNGDFLLDMAERVDDQPYELMAHQLARVTFANRAYRDGGVVFPDERGDPSPTWGDGVSGILAFLLRLRHRSARQWMVDSLLERSDRR